jgi:hypothetical protein
MLSRGTVVMHSNRCLGCVRLVLPGGTTVLVRYTNGTTVASRATDLTALSDLTTADRASLILADIADGSMVVRTAAGFRTTHRMASGGCAARNASRRRRRWPGAGAPSHSAVHRRVAWGRILAWRTAVSVAVRRAGAPAGPRSPRRCGPRAHWGVLAGGRRGPQGCSSGARAGARRCPRGSGARVRSQSIKRAREQS